MSEATTSPLTQGGLFEWRTHLKVHPAADLFPLLSQAELKELADDILKNGLRTRIIIYSVPRVADDGTIRVGDDVEYLLDGRNRLDALAALGFLCQRGVKGLSLIPFSLGKTWNGEEWEDSKSEFDCDEVYHDPYEVALSLNVHRRHLSADDKRDLIAKVLKAAPEKSNRAIAKQVKADDKTVGTVRRELEATAEIPQLEKTIGADGKARKQPSKKSEPLPAKVKVNGQDVKTDDFSPAAQEQIAKALQPDARTPEKLCAALAKANVAIDGMSEELAHIDDPDTTYDTAWQEASQEIEGLSTENEELRAEIERLTKPTTPAVSYLDKPWLATAKSPDFNPGAPLGDLEKKLQGAVSEIDNAERAAAVLIHFMVNQRKQSVRSIAKLIDKDPKWVKEKFDLAKPVTAEAAA